MTTGSICILIPAFNEQKNIGSLIQEIKKLEPDMGLLVSDDGSTDQTVQEARALGATVLTAQINQGKGAALRRGFGWFIQSDYTTLITMDADGQHDPKEILLFVEAISKSDAAMIVGNRMENPGAMPFSRRITNQFLSWVISLIAKQNIPDSQCGFRAVRKEALKKIKLSTSHFEIESEMLLDAARQQLKIGWIPIASIYKSHTSQINPLEDTLRFFRFILKYLFDNQKPSR